MKRVIKRTISMVLVLVFCLNFTVNATGTVAVDGSPKVVFEDKSKRIVETRDENEIVVVTYSKMSGDIEMTTTDIESGEA